MTSPVAIIMGSQSDWETMRHAAETLASARDCLRQAHRFRPPHARPAVCLCQGRQGGRLQGHHCRRRRRRASAGHGGGADGTAGIRRARRIQGAVGRRFALLHRADAGRHSRRHAGDRQGRRDQRRAARRKRAGAERSRTRTRLAAWRKQQTDAVAERPEGSA